MGVSKLKIVGGGDDKKATGVNDIPRTKRIVDIQYGVQDGKTGKPSMYVYNRLITDPRGFDPKKHRETVYTENEENLMATAEYQDYMRSGGKKRN